MSPKTRRSVKPFRLSRRALLRGAGAAIALPWLEAMSGPRVARAADPFGPPVRLLFYYIPNGIHMARDQKTLYIVCSGSEKVFSYPIKEPGVLGKQQHFTTLRQPEGRTNTGGDGLTVDEDGLLYITSRRGVQVVSPKGEVLGILKIPEGPSNVTLVGDVLYVTARTSVYTLTRAR